VSNPKLSVYGKYEQACARIRELEAEVKTLKHIILVDNEKDRLGIRIAQLEASVEYHKGMAVKWESEAKADLVRITELETALRKIDDDTVDCRGEVCRHIARAALAPKEPKL